MTSRRPDGTIAVLPGLLAQLVEHIVHIDGVTGSSPVQTTTSEQSSLCSDDFLFEKQKNVVARFLAPVAVPAFFGARSARLKNSTAATRSPPFSRHRRQSARSPSFRRSSSSEKRPFPPPRGFCPAGGALFLFSPILASLAKGQGHSNRMARLAPSLIPYSSFLIPLFSHQGPLVKGGATPAPPGSLSSRPKESLVLTFSACHFKKNVLYFAYK